MRVESLFFVVWFRKSDDYVVLLFYSLKLEEKNLSYKWDIFC